jgi:hypothetical protein
LKVYLPVVVVTTPLLMSSTNGHSYPPSQVPDPSDLALDLVAVLEAVFEVDLVTLFKLEHKDIEITSKATIVLI